MDLQSMPVDILEHILLRVDSPSCLVRASCTCKQWRGIIAGAAFLRRIRSLHDPPVVGSYRNKILARPCFEPSPLPPHTIGSEHQSLDFLPKNHMYNWRVVDSRGSLLLLNLDFAEQGVQHRYMVVCEPFTRSHTKISPLAESSRQRPESEAFLLAGAEPGATDMSNFRVLYLSPLDGVVGVFTSGGSWRKLCIGTNRGKKMVCMGFAAGCIYWYTSKGKVYALDPITAKFSSSSLPDVEDSVRLKIFSKFAVTTGRDGEARVLFLGAGNKLKVFAKRKGGWVLEKALQLSPEMLGLPSKQNLLLDRAVPFSAETVGTVRIVASEGQLMVSGAVSLDVDTMQVERAAESKAFPIKLPWPTSLHALH